MNKEWDSRERDLENMFKHNQRGILKQRKSYSNSSNWFAILEMFISALEKNTVNTSQTIVLEDVIEFRENGFTVKTDAMDKEKTYQFEFEDSTYEMWKNDNDELEMKEIPDINE